MDAKRWRQVRTLVGHALDLPAEQRTEFLKQSCANDPELHKEVESLLQMEDTVGLFERGAQIPLERESDPSVWIGRELGPYRIEKELSHGGMGRVFKAYRIDGQFDQHVAVKILRDDIDTDEARRRFGIEKRIAGGLDHPNIAHILDGGVSNGLPYIIMEFVDGEPIDEYCGKHGITLRQRLELILKICEAVDHAHQRLIVHRDLKPSNILVTADGNPKLLDFGIAKFLDLMEDDRKVEVTKVGALAPFTPSYAAPEQFKGEAITTSTDQYALGCIIHVLLTGVLPYDVPAESSWEWMQAACGEKAPMTTAEALHKGGEEAKALRLGLPDMRDLERILSSDLAVIVSKALEKNPADRYRTLNDLRNDLQRYVEGRPILARPPTFRYLASKFIKRHRMAASLAALVSVAICVAIVVITWQWQVANELRVQSDRRLKEVQQVAEKFMFEYHDGIRNLPGALPYAQKMMIDSEKFLDELRSEGATDPSVLEDLAAAYQRLAQTQGQALASNSGEFEKAARNRQEAYEIRKYLLAQSPEDPHRKAKLVSILEDMRGAKEGQLGIGATKGYLAELIPLAEQVTKALPDDAEAQNMYALQLFYDAQVKYFYDRAYGDALKRYLHVRKLLNEILVRHPNDLDSMTTLAYTYTVEGIYQRQVIDNPILARASFQQAVEIHQRVVDLKPSDTSALVDWATDWGQIIAIDVADNAPDKALSEVALVKKTLQPALAVDSLDQGILSRKIAQLILETKVNLELNNIYAAKTAIKEAHQLNNKLVNEQIKSIDRRQHIGDIKIEDAKIAVREKNLTFADKMFKEAIAEIDDDAIKTRPSLRKRRIGYLIEYGKMLVASKQAGKAVQILNESITELERELSKQKNRIDGSLSRSLARTQILFGLAYELNKGGNVGETKSRVRGEDYLRIGSDTLAKIVKERDAMDDDSELLKQASAALVRRN
jgi:serine/threonine protein kinase